MKIPSSLVSILVLVQPTDPLPRFGRPWRSPMPNSNRSNPIWKRRKPKGQPWATICWKRALRGSKGILFRGKRVGTDNAEF